MRKKLIVAAALAAIFIFTALPALAANNITLTVDNFLTSITFTKRSSLSGKPLSGATYELFASPTEQLVGRYTTELGGSITIKGLVHGDYYFLESVPPKGYELSTERIYFTVDSTTSALEVVGKDAPASPEVEQPTTGEGTAVYIALGVAAAAVMGAAGLVFKKIKKGEK